MSNNPFTERYSTLSNAELFEILQSQHDYQPLAVEAARVEIERRNLTADEKSSANEELERKRTLKEDQYKKVRVAEETLKFVANSVKDAMIPLKSQPRSPELQIKIVSILLAVLFLAGIIKNFSLFKYSLLHWRETDLLSLILVWVPSIALALGIYFFWKKAKVGWIIVIIDLTALFSTIACSSIVNYRMRMGGGYISNIFADFEAPAYSIGSFIFCAGLLFLLFQKSIRSIYRIDLRLTMVLVSSVGALIIWQWWDSLFMKVHRYDAPHSINIKRNPLDDYNVNSKSKQLDTVPLLESGIPLEDSI